MGTVFESLPVAAPLDMLMERTSRRFNCPSNRIDVGPRPLRLSIYQGDKVHCMGNRTIRSLPRNMTTTERVLEGRESSLNERSLTLNRSDALKNDKRLVTQFGGLLDHRYEIRVNSLELGERGFIESNNDRLL
jgi:hypothetical protein